MRRIVPRVKVHGHDAPFWDQAVSLAGIHVLVVVLLGIACVLGGLA